MIGPLATRRWLGFVGVGLFLLGWHLAALRYNPVILPSPYETALALAQLVRAGHVTTAALMTCLHVLAGFGAAVLLGSVLGTLAGSSVTVRQIIGPVVTIVQGIPPIAWIVLALLWFGMDGGTPIFTVAAATLPIVFMGALEGTRAVDRNLLEMGRVFQAPRRVLITDIYLPHLLSYLFPVVVAGLGIAWKVALMSELLAADRGIGALLGVARINLDTAAAMAWIAVAVLLMFTFEYLVLHPLKRALEPWRTPTAPAAQPAESPPPARRSEVAG
jgi:NitT/TauT family transport system permease protein